MEYSAEITGRSYEDEDLPRLDSINFVLKHQKIKEVQVVTNTITERQRARKWHIGAFAGYGYGVTTKKPDAFIGIGITYNLW